MKQKLKLGVVEFITKKYKPNQPKKFLQPHQVKCLMTRIETHIRVLSSPFRILMTPEIDPPHHLRRYFLAHKMTENCLDQHKLRGTFTIVARLLGPLSSGRVDFVYFSV